MQYQILNWDTEILGIPTAKILPARLEVAELGEILNTLKNNNVKLVFWASDSQDIISQQAAHQNAGRITDYKVTYLYNLQNFDSNAYDFSGVETYLEPVPTSDMVQLSFEIAAFSRFANDPKISEKQRQNVYSTWLQNSANRSVAKEVLVVKDQNKVIGMVTLGEKNGRGDLALIAVDKNHRGQELGKKLVRAAQHWSHSNGFAFTQVVTQQTNPIACRLYKKCGYSLEKLEYFYHFWL